MVKEINSEYSLQGPMLTLKLQYFVHLMGRADSPEETPMLGKTEGKKRWGKQMMRWLDGITNQTVRNREGQGSCSPRGRKQSDTT